MFSSVAGGEVALSLPMKMPWHAVPAPSSAIESADAFGVGARRLLVRDLDRALAFLRPLHPERGVERVGGDDVERLGGRVSCAAGRVVEDRNGGAVPAFWIRTACCGFAGLAWFTTSSRPSASAPWFE